MQCDHKMMQVTLPFWRVGVKWLESAFNTLFCIFQHNGAISRIVDYKITNYFCIPKVVHISMQRRVNWKSCSYISSALPMCYTLVSTSRVGDLLLRM